jgi:signal transduction histidine kinase
MDNNVMQKILIVEDSRMFGYVLKESIEHRTGYHAEVARSLSEARALLQAGPGAYFLALADLNLPDAPDCEVIDLLHEAGVSCIAITGKFGEQMRERILSKNVVDYVLKDNVRNIDGMVDLVERLHRNQLIKVMVVDDSETMRDLLATSLKLHKFQVLEASNGVVALELLRDHPEIQVVIVDYAMPEMDGAELTRRIRRTSSSEELAIIGISGTSHHALSARFLKSGANDFLVKPFSDEELYCRVVQNVETIEGIRKLKRLNEVKNKFLGMAAHDLRNPITAIQGFSSLLLEDEEAPLVEEHREFVEMIREASQGMFELVNDLLDVSVIEQGRLDVVRSLGDFRRLVAERLRIQRIIAARKEIDIVDDLIPEAMAVFDSSRMVQVVDNLVSNAVKFSPPGTTVSVSLEREGRDLALRVRDEGPGISEEEQRLLFGEFQKLSARPTAGERSTGLGLAIVRKIVLAHSGSLEVDSDVGRGSVFCARIPVEGKAG